MVQARWAKQAAAAFLELELTESILLQDVESTTGYGAATNARVYACPSTISVSAFVARYLKRFAVVG
jgi:hypothetical protein